MPGVFSGGGIGDTVGGDWTVEGDLQVDGDADVTGTATVGTLNTRNIARGIANSDIGISGGDTGSTGANLLMFGQSATNANDIVFRRSGANVLEFDSSINTWDAQDKTITTTGPIIGDSVKTASFTVGTLPSASGLGAGTLIFVSDETGGAITSFSDATNWRRLSDRAIVS